MTEGPDNNITSHPDPPNAVPPNPITDANDDGVYDLRDYVATVTRDRFDKFVDATHSDICGNRLPTPALQDGTRVRRRPQRARCFDPVRFCGCTSDCVDPGMVVSTDFCTEFDITWKNGTNITHRMCNLILFTSDPLVQPGDSGSLLINTNTNRATGLVCGTAIRFGNPVYGLADPIRAVLRSLNVKIAR